MNKTTRLISRLRSTVTVLLLSLISTGIYAGIQTHRSATLESAQNLLKEEQGRRQESENKKFRIQMQHDEDTYTILALKRRLKRYETKYGKPVPGSYDVYTDAPTVEMK